ncbi:MAG: helix-turn-helix domain-containing protein [Methylobacteriaceae bacterium]|jgi:DNA-binding IclR family transcriptional regulator|nr:helix-turn-helix domain-containing protein [Methylobacteriaceae bacterium]
MTVNTKILTKVDSILSSFSYETSSWTATDLAKRLKLPVSTLHGILADLVTMDFLILDHVTKEYKIGSRYMEMGAQHINSFELNNIAYGMMRELTLRVNHLIGLSVLYNGWMYISISILPFERASGFRYAGSRYPGHLTAGGMAILAHMPAEQVRRYCTIDWGNVPVRPFTYGDLEQQLQTVRNHGYSIPFVDRDLPLPVRSIGAPVFGRNRQILAGLAIIGPWEGLTDDEIARHSRVLADTANEISFRCAHIRGSGNYVPAG